MYIIYIWHSACLQLTLSLANLDFRAGDLQPPVGRRDPNEALAPGEGGHHLGPGDVHAPLPRGRVARDDQVLVDHLRVLGVLMLAKVVMLLQSWALSVFLNFFNNKIDLFF